jgi:hypothetical protein
LPFSGVAGVRVELTKVSLRDWLGGRLLAGVDRGKTPFRLMGLDFFDPFFKPNLPGFHSFKYGDDFIEFFVGSHNSFLFGCTKVPNAWVFAPYYMADFTLDQLLGTNQGGPVTVTIIVSARSWEGYPRTRDSE